MTEPTVRETSIAGLFEVNLAVHGDNRGWFKENYQRDKLEALGLPCFEIVQNNISFNVERGVTRGIHAEPWDKYISVATGRVFSAIVDLRAGDGFGRLETFELGPNKAIFVPRGCGNSFQTLDPNTAYTYLVNEHWSPASKYVFANLFDPELAINWPIPRAEATLGDKDITHPALRDVIPMVI